MFTPAKKNRLILSVILFALSCFFSLAIFSSSAFASDEKKNTYPDEAGREALRLWDEKERDREVAEALRRYWDYWSSRQPRQYSAYRMWYELEQTQRWLKDPDYNPPPPPPPIPPDFFMPYPPYPYMYYPPPWLYGPWYPPRYNYTYPYERRRHRR